MIRPSDIHSLTDFTRNSKAYIQQIKQTKNPIAITINGSADLVIQDATEYQQMVEELEHARFMAAMREAELDKKNGNVEDIDIAFARIRNDLGLPS